MTDTLELLETIGKDASLRHASGEEMAQALVRLGASEAFTRAAVSGDSSHLKQDLGPERFEMLNNAPTVSQTVPDEEEGDDDDEPGGETEA